VSLSFGDALIAAAEREASCSYLLTEDLHPDLKIDGVLLVDPFVHTPAEFGLDPA